MVLERVPVDAVVVVRRGGGENPRQGKHRREELAARFEPAGRVVERHEATVSVAAAMCNTPLVPYVEEGKTVGFR